MENIRVDIMIILYTRIIIIYTDVPRTERAEKKKKKMIKQTPSGSGGFSESETWQFLCAGNLHLYDTCTRFFHRDNIKAD